MMKLEHYYVNLIDLPELLPFTISEKCDESKSSKEVFEFVELLEEFDSLHYIGQDNIEGKFYQRFLFSNGGFMEIMQKAPSAIVAHFADEERAEKFSEKLRQLIKKKCGDSKPVEMLAQDVKVNRETEGKLSYEKWSKLNNIRDSLTG